MKNIKIPPSLLKASDNRLIIEAIYYVVRVLRNSMRNYPKTPISTEPSSEVYDLAQLAVNEIEEYEKEEISDFSDGRIDQYIDALEQLLRETYSKAIGSDTPDAASILEEMRSTKNKE